MFELSLWYIAGACARPLACCNNLEIDMQGSQDIPNPKLLLLRAAAKTAQTSRHDQPNTLSNHIGTRLVGAVAKSAK